MGQVIAHTAINQSGPNGGTSAAIDTTGADLIIFGAVQAFAFAFTISDNQGNTYSDPGVGTATGDLQAKTDMFYVFNPTTSATHTFTISGAGSASSACILAVKTGISLDSTTTHNSNSASTTIAAGSVTASGSPAMVIGVVGASGAPAGSFSIDNGMTIGDQGGGPSQYFVALAYKFQNSAAAISPTWTASGSCSMAATNATFIMGPDTEVAVAITESPDVVAASLNSTFNVAVAITESPDSVAASLNSTFNTAIAITESPDVVDIQMLAEALLAIAITESPDAVFASLGYDINISITIGSEDADTVSIVLDNPGSWSTCTPIDTAWTDCTPTDTTWANCTNPSTDWTVN